MTGSVLAQSDCWPSPVKLPQTFINSRPGTLTGRRWTSAGIVLRTSQSPGSLFLIFMYKSTCVQCIVHVHVTTPPFKFFQINAFTNQQIEYLKIKTTWSFSQTYFSNPE